MRFDFPSPAKERGEGAAAAVELAEAGDSGAGGGAEKMVTKLPRHSAPGDKRGLVDLSTAKPPCWDVLRTLAPGREGIEPMTMPKPDLFCNQVLWRGVRVRTEALASAPGQSRRHKSRGRRKKTGHSVTLTEQDV